MDHSKRTRDLIFWAAIILATVYIYVGDRPDPVRARWVLTHMDFPYTPDHFVRAAHISNNKALRMFLASGMDPNAISKSGKTALMQAVLQDNEKGVELLLKYGADPYLPNQQGQTALDVALAQKKPQATRALLVHINKPDIPEVSQAFFKYTSEKNWQMVQAMLDAGVNPNAQAPNGQSAIVQSGGDSEITNALAAKGGDINIQDSRGRTALMMAAADSHPDAVRDLIQKGAKLNLQDKDGRTALMFAAWWLNDETVDALIYGGADPTVKDIQGRTALDYARLKQSRLAPESAAGNKELIVQAQNTVRLLQEAM